LIDATVVVDAWRRTRPAEWGAAGQCFGTLTWCIFTKICDVVFLGSGPDYHRVLVGARFRTICGLTNIFMVPLCPKLTLIDFSTHRWYLGVRDFLHWIPYVLRIRKIYWEFPGYPVMDESRTDKDPFGGNSRRNYNGRRIQDQIRHSSGLNSRPRNVFLGTQCIDVHIEMFGHSRCLVSQIGKAAQKDNLHLPRNVFLGTSFSGDSMIYMQLQ
jgi:hypothetical protein